jgi:3-methyladenine DNA glycosylase AlkD
MERSAASQIIITLEQMEDPVRASHSARYFKTGKGEYGEGDIFWGITVPLLRQVAKKFYPSATLEDIKVMLSDPVHEVRLTALLILVQQFNKANDAEKEAIYNFYLQHTEYINNWDLVDLSSHEIVGQYLLHRDRKILFELAHSESIWDKRIAMISTFEFIRNKDFKDSFTLADILLLDKHDLIRKAVGWMLREVYKKEPQPVRDYLKQHAAIMPRVTLRYAIEKMDKTEQQLYLSIK